MLFRSQNFWEKITTIPQKPKLKVTEERKIEMALEASINRINKSQQRRDRICYLPDISIKTATALKDLGYKLSPRLMDKNEEFYYKVYLV